MLLLFVAIALFDVAAPLHGIALLGAPSLRSLFILCLSLLWPLLAAMGCLLVARRWRALSRPIRVGGVVVAAGYLTAAAALALHGWLPLVTWLA